MFLVRLATAWFSFLVLLVLGLLWHALRFGEFGFQYLENAVSWIAEYFFDLRCWAICPTSIRKVR